MNPRIPSEMAPKAIAFDLTGRPSHCAKSPGWTNYANSRQHRQNDPYTINTSLHGSAKSVIACRQNSFAGLCCPAEKLRKKMKIDGSQLFISILLIIVMITIHSEDIMKNKIRMIGGLSVTLLLMGLLIWWIFLPGHQIEDKVKVYRMGMITASDLQLETIEGFREAMVGLGYNEGVNIIYYIQNPKGDRELTKKLAKDLVAKDLDLYVSFSTTATKAMQDAQKGTGAKIVFGDVGDYTELGLESIRNPGKKNTGVTTGKIELSGKRMEILKEAVPDARVFGIIWNPSRANINQIKKMNEGVIATSDATISGQNDKIFKGAQIDNIPVEFPRMVELHLNATLAKEIGIELPPGLLQQATFIKR